jgi:hypothetical protein
MRRVVRCARIAKASSAGTEQAEKDGVTMADAEGEPQAPKGFTNNALLSAIVSVIIAGVISFVVAHWQSQDAARQAVTAQQVQEVLQLETAAETFDQAAYSAYADGWQCAHRVASACQQEQVSVPGSTSAIDSPLSSAQNALIADMNNVSDPAVRTDASNLVDQVQGALTEDGSQQGTTAWTNASEAYAHLLIRCGQLIKGG